MGKHFYLAFGPSFAPWPFWMTIWTFGRTPWGHKFLCPGPAHPNLHQLYLWLSGIGARYHFSGSSSPLNSKGLTSLLVLPSLACTVSLSTLILLSALYDTVIVLELLPIDIPIVFRFALQVSRGNLSVGCGVCLQLWVNVGSWSSLHGMDDSSIS